MVTFQKMYTVKISFYKQNNVVNIQLMIVLFCFSQGLCLSILNMQFVTYVQYFIVDRSLREMVCLFFVFFIQDKRQQDWARTWFIKCFQETPSILKNRLSVCWTIILSYQEESYDTNIETSTDIILHA